MTRKVTIFPSSLKFVFMLELFYLRFMSTGDYDFWPFGLAIIALERSVSRAENGAELAKKSNKWCGVVSGLNLPLVAAKACCPLYSQYSALCSLQFTSVTVIKATLPCNCKTFAMLICTCLLLYRTEPIWVVYVRFIYMDYTVVLFDNLYTVYVQTMFHFRRCYIQNNGKMLRYREHIGWTIRH